MASDTFSFGFDCDDVVMLTGAASGLGRTAAKSSIIS
jgi:hypothetical protein